MSDRARSRVPEPTASFWLVKVLTTGMGEAVSDFLVTRFDPVPTVLLTAVVFVVVLGAQLRLRRYVPAMYWAAVSMVGIFGTMAADVVHVALDIPYAASTPVFLLTLAAVFLVWRRTEGSIDVHTVTTDRRELLYWAAVITTFAAGTAAGDLLASTADLGYFSGAVFFGAIMAVIVGLRSARVIGPVVGFWAAYVVTRPLGASIADGLGVGPERGGLGFGSGAVGGVGLVCIALIVCALSVREARTRPADATDAGASADRPSSDRPAATGPAAVPPTALDPFTSGTAAAVRPVFGQRKDPPRTR